MSVFKNGQNDYQLDFSNRLSSRLGKLDSDKLSELSSYLQNKFRWLFTITADFPVLKTGFSTQEEADKADRQLHNTISAWFKGRAKPENPEPETQEEIPDNSHAKWILITVVNNDIYDEEFDTYDSALATMQQEYDDTVEDWDDAYFTSDYASIQTTVDRFDWKIVRVDFR